MKHRRLFAVLLALAAMLLPAVTAQAASEGEATPLTDFEYELSEDGQSVILTKYIGTGTAVTVADSYTVDGVSLPTVLATETVFRGNTTLKSAAIGGGVRYLNDSMRLLFGECTKLTSVDLSQVNTTGVTNLNWMFYKCEALTSLDLSAFDTSSVEKMQSTFSVCKKLANFTGYENWDTSKLRIMYQTFNQVGQSVKLDTIDLRNWDLSHLETDGWCFQNCYAHHILLPDNLCLMSAGFLNHAKKVEGSTFEIPAGVEKIGYAHTIYDFATDDFVAFTVAEGNEHYVAADGILYSADMTEMLAVPRNKPFEDNTYEIPEGVSFLGELSFSRNYNIHTLVLPDSYEIEYIPLNDERYITYQDTGNLNAGTNLSIAIYCYTGITDYVVKDTNPRYASADGIIYSKDMTEVVAIPSRYAKVMAIPEGVTSWDYEAMWGDASATVDGLLANCPGVELPSTLKTISVEQLDKLNRLHADRESGDNPFTITLAAGNKSFYLDESGALCPVGPIIASEPADWYGTLGQAPEITVGARGDGLRYQWYYRGAGETKWHKSSDVDACYDSYPLTVERAGREVYCLVTDSAGRKAKSRVAVMDFDVPDGWTGPTIVAQPEDWRGLLGENPTITFTVEGEELQYQWYYRNKNAEKWAASSDCDDCYDSYPLTAEREGRTVYCVATDKYGFTVTSAEVTMDRFGPEGWSGPTIVVQPQDWHGRMGAYPSISVEAEGEELQYQWYYRNKDARKWTASSDRDDCYDSYPLTSVRDGREVYCLITDKYGCTVRSASAFMRAD